MVAWGKLAGTCKRHLHTGRRVAISGQLCVDEFLVKQGDLRRRWFLRAEHVTFLDAPVLHPAATPVTTRPRRCPVQTVELTSSPAATGGCCGHAAADPASSDAADFFSWPLLIGVGGVAAVVSYVRRRRRRGEEVTGGDG